MNPIWLSFNINEFRFYFFWIRKCIEKLMKRWYSLINVNRYLFDAMFCNIFSLLECFACMGLHRIIKLLFIEARIPSLNDGWLGLLFNDILIFFLSSQLNVCLNNIACATSLCLFVPFNPSVLWCVAGEYCSSKYKIWLSMNFSSLSCDRNLHRYYLVSIKSMIILCFCPSASASYSNLFFNSIRFFAAHTNYRS